MHPPPPPHTHTPHTHTPHTHKEGYADAEITPLLSGGSSEQSKVPCFNKLVVDPITVVYAASANRASI